MTGVLEKKAQARIKYILVCVQHHHHYHLHFRGGQLCRPDKPSLSFKTGKQKSADHVPALLRCPSLDPPLSFVRLYCKHYMNNAVSFAFIQIHTV